MSPVGDAPADSSPPPAPASAAVARRLAALEAADALSTEARATLDAAGAVLDANPRWRACFGEPSAGAPAPGLYGLVAPRDHAALAALLVSAGHDAQPATLHASLRFTDGTWRACALSVVALPGLAGSDATYCCLCRDDDDPKLGRGRLEDLAERGRGIFEHAPVGIAIFDAEGECLEVNPAMQAIVGAPSRAALLAQNFRGIASWRSSGLLDVAERVLAQREPDAWAQWIETSHGRRFFLRVRFVPLEAQGRQLLLCLAEDLSDERRREEAMVVQQRRLLHLQEISRQLTSAAVSLDSLLQTTVDRAVELVEADFGAIVEIAEATGQASAVHASASLRSSAHLAPLVRGRGLLGVLLRGEALRVDDVRGHPVFAGFPEWHPEVEALLGVPVHAGERLLAFALVGRRPGRRPFEAADQELVQSLASLAGAALHAARQMEDLRRARRRAEEASRAKDQFLANVSHEVRTPLHAVLGVADLLWESPLDAEQRSHLALIRSSGEQLAAVLEDMIDFGRIETGHFDLQPRRFELLPVVEQTVALMGVAAAVQGLELAVRVDPALPAWWWGDPDRLRQVLSNLVGNAVKFTSKGGVWVEVLGRAQADDTYLLHGVVRDTGPGVPQDSLERIFDAFTQGDASTTRKFGGTGLGLAICRRICQRMGGNAWAESVPGQGSSFHFTVRIAALRDPLAPSARSLFAPSHRMLLATADELRGRALEELLVGWGALPTRVRDSAQCQAAFLRAALEQRPFSLVLLDSALQGPAAERLVELLRGLPAGAECRFLGMGQPRPGAPQPHGGGHDAILSKPVTRADLAAALDDLLYDGSEARAAELGSGSGSLPAAGGAARAPGPASGALGHAQGDERPASRPQQAAAAPSVRVLVADDNDANRRVLQGMLERDGHSVQAVSDGIAAVEAAAAAPGFDLILMDVQMPSLDGLEATRRIRALPGAAADVLVVAMTAHALSQDRQRCLSAGMDAYLSKPVRWDSLRDLIARLPALRSGETPGSVPSQPALASVGGRRAALAEEGLLEAFGHDRDLVREVAGVFLSDGPQELASLVAAWQLCDGPQISQSAHRLRGAAANLRLERLAAALEALELLFAGVGADLPVEHGQSGAAVARVQSEWEPAVAALRALVAR